MFQAILFQAVLYTVIDIASIALLAWVIVGMTEDIFPRVPTHKYPIQLYSILKGSNRFLAQDLRVLSAIVAACALLVWFLPTDAAHQLIAITLVLMLGVTSAVSLAIVGSIRYLAILDEACEVARAKQRAVLPETFRF